MRPDKTPLVGEYHHVQTILCIYSTSTSYILIFVCIWISYLWSMIIIAYLSSIIHAYQNFWAVCLVFVNEFLPGSRFIHELAANQLKLSRDLPKIFQENLETTEESALNIHTCPRTEELGSALHPFDPKYGPWTKSCTSWNDWFWLKHLTPWGICIYLMLIIFADICIYVCYTTSPGAGCCPSTVAHKKKHAKII